MRGLKRSTTSFFRPLLPLSYPPPTRSTTHQLYASGPTPLHSQAMSFSTNPSNSPSPSSSSPRPTDDTLWSLTTASIPTILILGGSYGGLQCASTLVNGGLPEGWRVIVVDRNSHFNRESSRRTSFLFLRSSDEGTGNAGSTILIVYMSLALPSELWRREGGCWIGDEREGGRKECSS